MDDKIIFKNLHLDDAQDFAQLRMLGMNYIRQLSAVEWTDHNLHDPGITTLEILSYALTDLAYRTSFSTEDLLTQESDFISEPSLSSFYPAQQALTTTPLTQLDYRKLLLKIDGIRNAWLTPLIAGVQESSELAIYIDYAKTALSLDELNIIGQTNAKLHINGLYQVWLELEADPEFGSLNETALPITLKSLPFKGYTGQVLLLNDNTGNSHIWANRVIAAEDPITVALSILNDHEAEVDILHDTLALPTLKLVLDNDVDDSVTPADWHQLFFSDVEQLLTSFISKQSLIKSLLAKAQCALQENRNLCEDYKSVSTISADYVAVCADIEVAGAADLEKVQAQVYFAIEQYLNPPVNFYSLNELLEQKHSTDSIFNGPYINHQLQHQGQAIFNKPGFVLDEELEASELRKVIYSSDIINELMDIDEVVAVKSILLRKYDAQGHAVGDSDAWCLPIRTGHQPVLAIKHCKILFFKQAVPFIAQHAEFQATLRHLRATAIKQAYTGIEEALTIPIGTYREITRHFPIQHDFPQTYQIGETGLQANASAERIAQARQFKAYLLFFEQMLADYLAQLGNVSKLFSLDETLKYSYFSQNITNINGCLGEFADEFYLDKTLFSDPDKRNMLREDEQEFHRRRNRLLDHLLARFAEKFNDYVMMMYQQSGDTLKTNDELIKDKVSFLRMQPVLSRERNRAFNYRPKDLAQVWDSDNVSGLEKRTAKLAGMESFARRNLSCQDFFSILFDTRKTGDEFRIEIKDPEQHLLFKSTQLYLTRAEAMADALIIYPHLLDANVFSISAIAENEFRYQMHFDVVTFTHDETFLTEADAQASIDSVIARHEEVLAAASGEELEGEPDHPFIVLFDTREYGCDYRVEIKDPGQFILFKSRELYSTRAQAIEQAKELFVAVRERKNYQIDDSGGAGTVFYRLSFAGVTLTHDVLFDSVADATHSIERVIARYYEVLEGLKCNNEGMYLIEHLLLRPRRANARLLDVCLHPEKASCGDEDPYSFRASVILPYWPKRFQSLSYRRFLENSLREQSPAHVHLKICWIDHTQMAVFEVRLQAWLQALATEAFDSELLNQTQNDLIDILEQLKTVFPTARLHDCRDDDDGQPVLLGSTNLGTV